MTAGAAVLEAPAPSVAASGSVAALAVERVSHRYGARKALNDVSLVVPQSRFVALLGPNGAGKTTLFSLITRLYDTQKGSIRVLGHAVSRDPGEALRRLGVVFQARTLDLDLSLQENLLYHAAFRGFPPHPPGRARPSSWQTWNSPIARERRRRNCRAARSGEWRSRARCCTGRACWCWTSRPWGSMSARNGRSSPMSAGWSRDQGVAVLWATHLLDEVEPEDDVVVLHRGQVRVAGSAASVVAQTGADRSARRLHPPDGRRRQRGGARMSRAATLAAPRPSRAVSPPRSI